MTPPMLSLLKSFSCINGQHFIHWHGGAAEKITQREKDLIDAAYLLGRQHEAEQAAKFSGWHRGQKAERLCEPAGGHIGCVHAAGLDPAWLGGFEPDEELN